MAYLKRDYYIGHPDDDREVFEQKMAEILYEDDPIKLHEYLKVFDSSWFYPPLLDMCLEGRGFKCALHIIEGKLPHGPPSLANDHIEPTPYVPVLYVVIQEMCEPNVFHHLFTHCEAATQVNEPLVDLLPIHWLLDLLVEIPPLSNWSPGQPLSDLIDSLYAPQVRTKLECAQMLAQHTRSLDQIALSYFQNGEIIPLAALLLVAPFTSRDFETLKPYTSFQSIASRAIHGQSVTPETYCAAAALLHTFEKRRNELTSKFNNRHKGSAQAEEQSFAYQFIPQLQKLFDQVSKGQSIPDLVVQQIGSTSSVGRLSSTSPFQMSHRDVGEIRTFCTNIDNATEHLKSGDAHQVNYTHLLHSQLSSLVKCDYLSKWSPGQSLLKLILLLFLQRESKPILDIAQSVAEHIDAVNEVALNLIRQGELIQLAGLFLVAHNKAMKPFDSGDTIKEAASMDTVFSQVFRGEPVTSTVGAAGLFEIFEKAGDRLAKYWSIHDPELEPVQVIVEVATRIQRHGIQLLPADVDVTDIYGTSSHPEMLETICGRLGIKIDDTSELSPISGNPPFPSVASVKETCFLSEKPMSEEMPELSPEEMRASILRELEIYDIKLDSDTALEALGALGKRAYSTLPSPWACSPLVRRGALKNSIMPSPWACSPLVRRGALKHSILPSPLHCSPLVRNLGYLAMKLKRGVRFV